MDRLQPDLSDYILPPECILPDYTPRHHHHPDSQPCCCILRHLLNTPGNLDSGSHIQCCMCYRPPTTTPPCWCRRQLAAAAAEGQNPFASAASAWCSGLGLRRQSWRDFAAAPCSSWRAAAAGRDAVAVAVDAVGRRAGRMWSLAADCSFAEPLQLAAAVDWRPPCWTPWDCC